MRDSLGVTGKKDPFKQSDESIKVETSLHQKFPHDLDINVIGQSFGEFVYEVGTEGNMVNLFEYKIVKDTRDKKLDELAYNYTKQKEKINGSRQGHCLTYLRMTRTKSTPRKKRCGGKKTTSQKEG